MATASPNRSRVAPAATAAIGLAAMLESLHLGLGKAGEPGPGLWPFAASCLVAGASVWLVISGGIHLEALPGPGRLHKVVLAGSALAAFIPLFSLIGLPVPGFLLLVVWLRLFHEPWRTTLLVAAGGAVALHVLFVYLLAVPLPVGPLAPGL